MKIIFNSDILTQLQLPSAKKNGDISRSLCQFCQKINQSGHTIIIPKTVELELERIQRDNIKALVEKFKGLQNELEYWGIGHSFRNYDLPDHFHRDLVAELKSCGASVQIEHPLLEDFQSAQERAALRLPPHSYSSENSKKNSDEMRDLVIWCISVRIATKEEGALLLSKDEIHVSKAGDSEAQSSGLIRLKSLDNALHFLEIESSYDLAVKEVLKRHWNVFLKADFNKNENEFKLFIDSFFQGTEGVEQIIAKIVFLESEGNILSGKVKLMINNEMTITKVIFYELSSSSGKDYPQQQFRTEFVINLPELFDKDYLDRLNSLKDIL
ncbi:MAG: hypothetical protein R3D00_11940 [Bacteroidia bacterium]